MNELKNQFTENEWLFLQYAPVSVSFALIITGFKITNFFIRIKEFAGVLSILKKCADMYPNNVLIQETVGSIKELSELSIIAERLQKISKKENGYDSLLESYNNKEIDSFLDKIDDDSILKSTVHICLYPMVIAKSILVQKNIPERDDYMEAINKIAYETALASKEGFFGTGDRISKEENRVLSQIKYFTELIF